eukprot:CAMPEP_0185759366 /NCGR_PEP_ID=MMETSP1174-20130828/18114_1 /TAXON_ID=35687 /ORGANISM="Dictyocha speculum, Strain CCMP1381" /LENGTH=282 /DNA_ID=CAMNT_0028439675 /DNA_START=70 /DNA_END=915 /DNA_ORIENTATION=+
MPDKVARPAQLSTRMPPVQRENVMPTKRLFFKVSPEESAQAEVPKEPSPETEEATKALSVALEEANENLELAQEIIDDLRRTHKERARLMKSREVQSSRQLATTQEKLTKLQERFTDLEQRSAHGKYALNFLDSETSGKPSRFRQRVVLREVTSHGDLPGLVELQQRLLEQLKRELSEQQATNQALRKKIAAEEFAAAAPMRRHPEPPCGECGEACPKCTYENKPGASTCEMCRSPCRWKCLEKGSGDAVIEGPGGTTGDKGSTANEEMCDDKNSEEDDARG